jgi:hypothetical protein
MIGNFYLLLFSLLLFLCYARACARVKEKYHERVKHNSEFLAAIAHFESRKERKLKMLKKKRKILLSKSEWKSERNKAFYDETWRFGCRTKLIFFLLYFIVPENFHLPLGGKSFHHREEKLENWIYQLWELHCLVLFQKFYHERVNWIFFIIHLSLSLSLSLSIWYS